MSGGRFVSRGKAKRADYVLYYKPKIPIAVIEAKDNNQTVGAGMQQALEYGAMLDVPFVYSSNGDAFLEHDRTKSTGKIENEIPLNSFHHLTVCGKGIAHSKGLTIKLTLSLIRNIMMTEAARHPDIISRLRSTERSRQSLKVKTEFCWSWPQAPARLTRHFK